jgi:tRNA A-37 threonylcarbamoyl transferase component Bud32
MTTATCPSRDQLATYAVGQLPEPSADAVSAHLRTCGDCAAVLETLDDSGDTLIARLRAPAGEVFEAEAACQGVLARLRQLGAGAAAAGAAPAEATQTFTARRLGEYELLAKLGEGGMGAVYRARQTKLGRIVALKVLSKPRQASADAVQRFEREMLAAGRVEHPNVVRAYDAREIEGVPVLAMEYVDGLDLGNLLLRLGPLPVAEAAELIRQAALGLQAAHEHGLVHRDIKPSNLMLSRAGQVKVLDLGLARIAAAEAFVDEITSANQVMGTADYIAPEQVSDTHAADIRADLYSLGCTLYKLLAGHAPFSGPQYPTGFAKMTGHARDPVPPLQGLRHDVPAGLADVLDRLLAKSPAARPAEPREAAELLAPFAAGADLVGLLRRAETEPSGDVPAAGSTANRISLPGVATEKTRAPVPKRWLGALLAEPRRAAAVALAALLCIVALTVIIRIRTRDRQETTLKVPDGSTVTVRKDGVEVEVPEGAAPKTGGAKPQPPDQPPLRPLLSTPVCWSSRRFDAGGTSFCPAGSTRRTGTVLEPYPWKPAPLTGPTESVLTADMDGNGYPEVVAVEGATLVVYDRFGAEQWRRSPVTDSGVELPPGRVGCISPPELADFDRDGRPEICLLTGSRAAAGWTVKGPMRVVVYDGRGNLVRNYGSFEGGVDSPQYCFDFDGDGRPDIVFATGVYRHPHALCIRDFATGRTLWRHDFADGPVLGGVGDVDGDGKAEMLAIVGFDCHVDPPVDDYDSDHCYAVLFDAVGKRLWKRDFRHALNGCLADLDGDGKCEIIVLHETETEGALHLLDPADGKSRASLPGLAAKIGRAWAVADLKGDGRKQVVVGDGEMLHVMDAAAKPVARKALPDGRVAAANDFNGDGRVEILVRQGADLVVFDGQWNEIARRAATAKIQSAIVTDLDRDGINEALLRVGEGKDVRVEIMHFAAAGQDMAMRSDPGEVAKAFFGALRAGDLAQAAELAPAAERDALRKKYRKGPPRDIPAELKLHVAARLDDARAEVAGLPHLSVQLKFVDGQWWVVGF